MYNSSNLHKYSPIIVDDIKGYILPHASTYYTGNIISHTLRFRPKYLRKFTYFIFLH